MLLFNNIIYKGVLFIMKLRYILLGTMMSVTIMSFGSQVDAAGERLIVDGYFQEEVIVEMRKEFLAAAREGKVEAVKDLVQRGIDINTSDRMGITALMWAAMEGQSDVVKFLIDQGADVNRSTNAGNTALIWAASNNHTGIIEMLLEQGAKINAANAEGETALILASSKKYTDSMEILFVYGADIRIRDANGKNAAECFDDRGSSGEESSEITEDSSCGDESCELPEDISDAMDLNYSKKQKNHCCTVS